MVNGLGIILHFLPPFDSLELGLEFRVNATGFGFSVRYIGFDRVILGFDIHKALIYNGYCQDRCYK